MARSHLNYAHASTKLEAVKKARIRLRAVFEKVDAEDQFEFSYELDHLSRTDGEESYIAVVHIDGNDMGGFIKKLVQDCSQNNLDYIQRMRDFSANIQEAATKALGNTLNKLRDQIHKLEDQTSNNNDRGQKDKWVVTEVVPKRISSSSQPQQKITLHIDDDSKKPCWPILPIVFGGDDLTFVCNGQLGLSLATIYMREFAVQTQECFDTPFHTGAGICVVKVHYPFRRAYSFSSELTKRAKSSLGRERSTASALDWQFSTTGLSGGLSFIREREYETTQGSLLIRPVRFTQSSDWHTWGNFNRLVATFNYDERWKGRRNKLKALRDALRDGEAAVKEFRATYLESKNLPELHNGTVPLQETGWDGRRCAYFDALEAMDHHFLLEDLS